MNEVVKREDREEEIAKVDAEFREVMENSMYPRQDIDYDDIRPIPIPPFTFPPGTSFREQIILKISYLDQKVHIEKENERRKILREVVLKELDPFDRLMEQIISDRLQGKFPEKPIDPTMNKHFARPDSYIRTYMSSKYRFTQNDLNSFWQPETRTSELMMEDDDLFKSELLKALKHIRIK